MPSTYTDNLGIEKIANGEQSGTWGDTTNLNFDILDQAINGIATVTLASAGSSGSPNTLAITDGALSDGRAKFIEFVDGGDLGADAYVQLTPNDAEKIVFVRNSLSADRRVILFQGTYDAARDFLVAPNADVVVKFGGGGSVSVVENVFQNVRVEDFEVGGTLEVGAGSVHAMKLRGNATPVIAVGGSTNAAIVSTYGTGSGSGHVGVEVPANDSNDGFYIVTDSDQDGTPDTLAVKVIADGKVGIGTASPSEALSVSGNISVTGTVDGRDIAADGATLDGLAASSGVTYAAVQAAGALMDNECTSVSSVKAINQGLSTGSSPSFGGLSVDSGTLYVDSTNNRVGIGTTSPSSALTVNGTGTVTGALFVTSNLTVDSGTLHVQAGSSNVGLGTFTPGRKLEVAGNARVTGDLAVNGSLSKGSGSFRIDHPLKPETHHLVHSFIEGPQADNIYRGRVDLVDGLAAVNLDQAARMMEGTFVLLNGNVQCFTSNESDWCAVRGSVSGNILTIEAQDPTCTATISWMVVGERIDSHIVESDLTDENGRVITEPEKTEDDLQAEAKINAAKG